jgi:hypothetical protein
LVQIAGAESLAHITSVADSKTFLNKNVLVRAPLAPNSRIYLRQTPRLSGKLTGTRNVASMSPPGGSWMAPSPRNLRAVGRRAVHAGGNPPAFGAQRAAASGAPRQPDIILGWYRQLVGAKFNGSQRRRSPGRPRVSAEIENLVVRLARENSGWGYDRWERWPTWGTQSPARPRATFCAGMASRPYRREAKRLHGGISFAGTWTSWLARTSSLSKC